MIAALALLLAAQPAIEHLDRRPLAWITVAPHGAANVASTSHLIRAASRVLAAETDLFVVPLDPELVRECGGRLACLAARARSEVPQAELLAVMSAVPRAGADSVTAVLLDLTEALRAAESAGAEDAEIEIEARALAAPRVQDEVASADEADAFVERCAGETWRAALERGGHLRPFGELVLTLPAPAVLAIDGQIAATSSAGVVRVRLRAGTRRVALEGPGILPWSRSIDVPRDGVIAVEADLSRSTAPSTLRTAVLWGGTGLAASGVALSAYALASVDGDAGSLCLYMEADPPAACTAGGGLASPASLGLGLTTFGVTTALLTWLIGQDDDAPWLQLAIGAGAGVLTFAVLEAAN